MRESVVIFSVIFAVSVLVLVGFKPSMTGAFIASPGGEITEFKVRPQRPLIAEEFEASTSIKNPQDEKKTYLLKLLISHEGKLVRTKKMEISIYPKNHIDLKMGYTPSKVGDWAVVAKLTDKQGTRTYSSKSESVKVVSETGPFDLSVNPLSGRARPDTQIPILHTMKNMGLRGTDVKLRVEMGCQAGEDRVKESWIYLSATDGIKQKLVSLSSCPKTGLKEITSKIILNGKTWVESTAQIFLTEDLYPITMDYPGRMTVKGGEWKTFEVTVENEGNQSLSHARLAIQNVPLEWYSVSPKGILTLEPKESGLFLVNLSVPRDVEPKEYSVKYSVATDSSIATGSGSLKVKKTEKEEEVREAKRPFKGWEDAFQPISKYRYALLVGLVAVLLFVAYRMKSRENYKKKEKMRKIKSRTGV